MKEEYTASSGAASRENGFPTRSDTNRAVRKQKMVRGLKFRIKREEGFHYLSSENKSTDHCLHMQISGFPMTRLL